MENWSCSPENPQHPAKTSVSYLRRRRNPSEKEIVKSQRERDLSLFFMKWERRKAFASAWRRKDKETGREGENLIRNSVLICSLTLTHPVAQWILLPALVVREIVVISVNVMSCQLLSLFRLHFPAWLGQAWVRLWFEIGSECTFKTNLNQKSNKRAEKQTSYIEEKDIVFSSTLPIPYPPFSYCSLSYSQNVFPSGELGMLMENDLFIYANYKLK